MKKLIVLENNDGVIKHTVYQQQIDQLNNIAHKECDDTLIINLFSQLEVGDNIVIDNFKFIMLKHSPKKLCEIRIKNNKIRDSSGWINRKFFTHKHICEMIVDNSIHPNAKTLIDHYNDLEIGDTAYTNDYMYIMDNEDAL